MKKRAAAKAALRPDFLHIVDDDTLKTVRFCADLNNVAEICYDIIENKGLRDGIAVPADASKRGRLCDFPASNPLKWHMKRIAYLRVSTAEQRPDRQIDGLKDFCDELHLETLSACSAKRPVFDHVIRRLQPGDMLVVWDLDRAFRSVIDALTEAEKLRARGVEFKVASLNIDTTTPAGIFVYTMAAALAEFERRILSQRTKEGLQAARRRGKRIGRPRALTDRQVNDARARIAATGESRSAIARELGVPRWTLCRSLKRTAGP